MPVIGGSSTPTVSVQVPVPSPVQSKKPRKAPVGPVSFGGEKDDTPPQPTGATGVPAAPRPNRQLRAIILPWSPPPQKMRRGTPRRYSENDHTAFHEAINNGDTTARKVYADYLDERPGSAEPWVIHLLRHHDGQLHVRNEGGKPTLNFVKTVNPGVIDRRGLPTTIRFTNGNLSITGHSDQTIMRFREYNNRGHQSIRDVKPRKGWTPRMVRKFHDVWDRYHMNDSMAGSPAQQEHLRSIRGEYPGYPTSYYDWARERLAAVGLNPDPTDNYQYGSAWRREEVPAEVLHFLATLPKPEEPRPRKPPTQMRRLPQRVIKYSQGSSDRQ